MLTQTENINEIMNNTSIPKVIARRLKKEHTELIKTCNKIIIEHNETGELFFNVYKQEKKYLNLYSFKITLNYPFTPPILKINGNPSNEFYNLPTNRFRQGLKFIKGINCMCCHSYLCNSNWSPAYTINNIIKQVEEYKQIKFNIVLKIISDKIKEKYLIEDIDLYSWLFDFSLICR